MGKILPKGKCVWKIYVLTLPREISGYDDDRRYVGMTRVSPKARWRNGKGYVEHKELWEDIQLFGWDSFRKEIVYETDDHKDAANTERKYIRHYNTTNELYGYNRTNGGDGVLDDVTVIDGTRKKHSEISKARWLNPEYRNKMSGDNCHFHNEVYSFKGGDNPVARAVVLLNTRERFECIKDAAEKYGFDQSHIGNCCKGKQRYCGSISGVKYVWVFAEDYEKMDDDEINRRLEESKTFYSNSAKKIIDLTNMIVYPTATKAAQMRGLSNATLSQHVHTDGLWAGCRWAYLKDYVKENGCTEEEILSKCYVVA